MSYVKKSTETQQNAPIIVDVEASGFGSHSYPIEIGIVLPDGDRFCTLIAPAPAWDHWDLKAEALHGLTREKLAAHGKSPEEVCQKLNALLQGKTLYTDAWSFDYPWIRTLFHAGQAQIGFTVSALEMILREEELKHWDATKAVIRKEIGAERHRASWDARVIQETFIALRLRNTPMGGK